MEILDAEAAVDKEVQIKVVRPANNASRTGQFAWLMVLCHLKHTDGAPKHSLTALTDIERRLPERRIPIPADISNHEPEPALEVDQDLFKSLKSARKSAAGGLSGMTVAHLRPLLESQREAYGAPLSITPITKEESSTRL